MKIRRIASLAFAAALALCAVSTSFAAEAETKETETKETETKETETKAEGNKGAGKKEGGNREGAKKWELLGSRDVTDKIDHDSIPVTAKEGKLSKLQVRVLKQPVQFQSVKIHFVNGEVQEVAFKTLMKVGEASKPIDVEGPERGVQSVEFLYDAQSLAGKSATIKLFGKP